MSSEVYWDNIPQELKDRNQWVVWRYEERGGKQTKVPYIPLASIQEKASISDPATWGSFGAARTVYELVPGYNGVGYVMSRGDPFVGVDLDDCFLVDGILESWAEKIVSSLDSYTEVTPSGIGLRVFVRAQWPKEEPKEGRRIGYLELYSGSHFLTITGNVFISSLLDIEERSTEIYTLWKRLFAPKEEPVKAHSGGTKTKPLGDEEIIFRAGQATNGSKFAALFGGDWSAYPSQSEADLALCNMLAFWTQDPAQIDSIVRSSKVWRPKWERADYRNSTIDKALRDTTTHYDGSPQERVDLPDRAESDDEGVGDDNLPDIFITNRPMKDIAADALVTLVDANDPLSIFVRSLSLVRVNVSDKGFTVIQQLQESHLRGHMARAAHFKKTYKSGDHRHVPPPVEIVRDILAMQAWPFPGLDAIVESPALRCDGSVIQNEGYDRRTCLYYQPAPDLEVPPVPDKPTTADVSHAKNLLWDVFGEFPFADDASYANTLALCLTPIVRPALHGNVPMALIDAPRAGTGKGLLGDSVALIASGRVASVLSEAREEDEWRKRITSLLREGATLIGIDNVEMPVGSPALASALTAHFVRDRVLGVSEMVNLPQRATWFATGNNIRLAGDMPRRCYWIRLDSQTARPWQRVGFKHSDLVAWVTEHRGEILAALLTLARAWYAAGKPPAKVPTVGSFEGWAHTVGGILAHAGIQGFLGNLEALYSVADQDSNQWEAFLSVWLKEFGEKPVTVTELCDALASDSTASLVSMRRPELREALPDVLGDALDGDRKGSSGRSFRTKLGKALAKRADVRYGDVQLKRAGSDTHANISSWKVRDMRDVETSFRYPAEKNRGNVS